jgi:hypothetical protein
MLRAARPARPARAAGLRPIRRAPARAARAAAGDDTPPAALAAAAAGLPAALTVLASSYVKATTGEGLQGDLLGGLEGVSYLVIAGVVAWSVSTKVRTGAGLPAGPGGLVGAAEGLSYLALAAGVGSIAYAAATAAQ